MTAYKHKNDGFGGAGIGTCAVNRNIYAASDYPYGGHTGVPSTYAVNKEKEAKEVEDNLKLIAPMMYSYHKNSDDGVNESEKPQQIFMAYNGIFVRRTEMFNGNKISVVTKIDKVPGLSSVKEGIEVSIAEKLPFGIFEELVANYRAIYLRDHTESAAQIYRLKEADEMWPGKVAGDYVVYYPVQENSGANTNYSKDLEAAVGIRQKHTLVMESHAHANFGAFFSGGDNDNEKAPLSYCVIGNVASDRVSFVGRFKLLDQDCRYTVEELFNVPEGIDPLLVSSLNLPEPSEAMLTNAKPRSASYVRTAYEIAEENMKRGVTGLAGGVGYGMYGRNSIAYGEDLEDYYDKLYRGPVTRIGGEADAQNFRGKRTVGSQGTRKNSRRGRAGSETGRELASKYAIDWLAENISQEEARELLKLIVPIAGATITVSSGKKGSEESASAAIAGSTTVTAMEAVGGDGSTPGTAAKEAINDGTTVAPVGYKKIVEDGVTKFIAEDPTK